MTLLNWKIEWKKKRNVPLHGDEIGILHAYGKPADFTANCFFALSYMLTLINRYCILFMSAIIIHVREEAHICCHRS